MRIKKRIIKKQNLSRKLKEERMAKKEKEVEVKVEPKEENNENILRSNSGHLNLDEK